MDGTITIRRFQPAEWQDYKAIRLEALRLDPGMFGNSLLHETAFDDSVWIDRLNNPYCACFGLYAGDELIGLTSIFCETDKPAEAYMTQSYIREAYRGQGLSAILFSARISWATENAVKVLSICHRASNVSSKAAIGHHGFSYSHSVSRLWPDGITEDTLYYTREL